MKMNPLCLLLITAVSSTAFAQDAFKDRIIPFTKKFCVDCHNKDTSEGQLDLTKYGSVESLGEHYRQWEHVITFLENGEMPPKDAEKPSSKLRAEIISAIRKLLKEQAQLLAGDPGVVLPRRLSNAEYNYTIRELTSVDIGPADAFPVDPASGEGFNNTGEALTMSPALFRKYYAAAQHVADHVLLKPSGMQFAPYSVVTYADQKKFYEQRIISFYEKHDVRYEDYLTVAWEYQNRGEEKKSKPIERWAEERNLSSRYMARLWRTLTGRSQDRFYLAWLRKRWQVIPNGEGNDAAKKALGPIRVLSQDLKKLSLELCPKETQAIVSNAGNPPIYHTDRRRKTKAERDTFNDSLIGDSQQLSVEFRDLHKTDSISLWLTVSDPDGSRDGIVVLSDLNFSTQDPQRYRANDEKRNTPLAEILKGHAKREAGKLKFGRHPAGRELSENEVGLQSATTIELRIPTSAFGKEKRMFFHAKATLDAEASKQPLVQVAAFDREPTERAASSAPDVPLVADGSPLADELRKSGTEFCSLFPNRFLYVDGTRGLSAGFHLIEGFFRDDRPLCRHVLSEEQNHELDQLWDELYFGTGIAERLLRGFVFFERSERNFMKHPDFDSIKEEDPKLVEEKTLLRFRDIYLARSNVKLTGEELKAHPIFLFFESIRTGLKEQSSRLQAARPIYLRQLESLARRAYRRPLTGQEIAQLRSFFEATCDDSEFGVEQAVRASIVRLLMSPHFCFQTRPYPEGKSVHPLSDITLASRLSYFLWSSMPDEELLAAAEAGRLRNSAELRKQLRRMLRDEKVSGFSLEFFGQWLGHRDFIQQNSVNRSVFKDFDDDLEQAMFEEPTRMISHLIRSNLPVTELLSSDSTFVNHRLAKHYGLPFGGEEDEWIPTADLNEKGRGGLLGMAVFLTKNSQPERTSPVKRGFWVFHKLLGQHIPPPPDDVAVLPAKETDTGGKTIRELLKLHTTDEKCARCHVRFDPVGLAMEGFDPIGRARSKDLAGRAVDTVIHLPNGKEVRGVPEFAAHLATERRADFVRTLCRKMLGYALGRSLLLSDQPLLEKMEATLAEDEYRFGPLFESVVQSPQFRNQRCRDFSTAAFRAEIQKD